MENIKDMTERDIEEFLQAYHNASAEFKKAINYDLYLQEVRRRRSRLISRAEVLTALNAYDRMEDDIGLVLVDPDEIVAHLFDKES